MSELLLSKVRVWEVQLKLEEIPMVGKNKALA
jgi:hypothetical protein